MSTGLKRRNLGEDGEAVELPEDKEEEEEDEQNYDVDDSKGMLDENKPILFLGWRRARLAYVMGAVHLLIIGWIMYYRHQLGLCLLLLHACNIPLFIWWWKQAEKVNMDQLALHYITAALPGMVVVYFFQYLLCLLFFGSYKGAHWFAFITEGNPGDWMTADFVVLACVCYVALAIPEEALKWYYIKEEMKDRQISKKELMYFVASILGFANAQAIVVVMMAFVVQNQWSGGVPVISILTVTLATPLHLITAYVIALKSVLHLKFSKIQGFCSVILPGVLARGTTLLSVILMVYFGPLEGWGAFFPCGLIILIYFVYAKSVDRHMPKTFHADVQYSALTTEPVE